MKYISSINSLTHLLKAYSEDSTSEKSRITMSGSKRGIDIPDTRNPTNKRPKLSADVLARIQQSRAVTSKKQQQQQLTSSTKRNTHDTNSNENEKNLLDSIEIHPLLKDSSPSPAIPKRFNPLKNKKSRPGFVVNPYIDQQDFSIAPERPKRTLNFNPQGKYIEKANEIRRKMELEKKEKEEQEELAKQGLVVNETLGEHNFLPEQPPSVEWWDRPLLKDRDYLNIDKDDRLTYMTPDEEEENPITIYIQHPVPITPPSEKFNVGVMPLFLTKKELKRSRKIERGLKQKEKQDRIKLGLDPTPAPKIKLKNLMNVLTNDAIKNPTEVEMRVKSEIEERRLKHEQDNVDRMADKDAKHEKVERKLESDLSKGYYSAVFKIGRLVNPQHIYKVDINAKQLKLTGMCLNMKDGMSLVVIEGGEKSVGKYKRLLLERITWTENVEAKEQTKTEDGIQGESEKGGASYEYLEDLRNNSCELLWEGQLLDLHFSKWTIYDFDNNDDILSLLSRYKLDNYWRQIIVDSQ